MAYEHEKTYPRAIFPSLGNVHHRKVIILDQGNILSVGSYMLTLQAQVLTIFPALPSNYMHGFLVVTETCSSQVSQDLKIGIHGMF